MIFFFLQIEIIRMKFLEMEWDKSEDFNSYRQTINFQTMPFRKRYYLKIYCLLIPIETLLVKKKLMTI